MGETTKPGSRVELAGDAGLITAGTFGLFTGLSLAIFSLGGLTPLGTPPKTPLEMSLMAAVAILSLAGTVVGPALTWVLHGRRIDRTAVLSAMAGYFVGGIVGGITFMLLVAVASLAAKPFTSWEFAGPVAAAAIVAVAMLAFVVWLDVGAVRDLSPSRREHVRLDVARLVSTTVIVVFAAVVALAMRSDPENEAGAFILAAGVFAGAGMAVTDWIVKHLERRKAAGG